MHIEQEFDKALTSKMRALIDEKEMLPYEIGSWESFDAKENGSVFSKYRYIWIGLAASMLIGMFLPSFYNKNSDTASYLVNEQFVSNTEKHQGITPATALENNITGMTLEILSKNSEEKSFKEDVPSNNLVESFDHGLTRDAFVFSNSLENGSKVTYKFDGEGARNKFETLEMKSCLFRRAKIGLQFSPLAGLNKGSEVGWSGGLIGEVPLINRFSITGGILIARQNVGINKTLYSEEAANTKSKARLFAMEFPINIKYNLFKRKKKDVSLSAGISSIAYNDEQFSDKAEVGNNNIANSFKDLEAAKFANLAAAVEFSIEKNLSILLEPFIKLPLGNTTSRDIKFANAGLNVRLNYSLARLN